MRLLPARLYLVTVVLVLLGSALIVAPLFDWQPQTWERVAMLWRERLPAVALPLLLVSAWQGQRLRPGLLPMGTPTQRSKVEIVLAFTWRLLAVAGLALIPALTVTISMPTAGGAPGSIPLASLVASFAGIATAVPLGLVLGAVIPRWGWPLTALVLGLLVWYLPLILNETLLVGTGRATRLVSLTWGMDVPQPGLAEPLGISLLRIGYFVLLMVMTIVAFSTVGASLRPLRKAAVALGAVAIPVLVMAGIGMASPRLPLVVTSGQPGDCTTLANARTQICVFEAHRELMPVILGIAEPLSQVLGASVPADVREGASRADDAAVVTLPVVLPGTEEEYRGWVVQRLVEPLFDFSACGLGEDDGTQSTQESEDAAARWTVMIDIGDRLSSAAGVAPRAGGVLDDGSDAYVYSEAFLQLQSLSDDAFGAWYRDHAEQIRACEITPEMLP